MKNFQMKDTQNSLLLRMLSARGLQAFYTNQVRELLIPANIDTTSLDNLYAEMGRYSFRLILRDIIKKQDSFTPEDLTRFSSIEKVVLDLDFLLRIGLIEKKDRRQYRLAIRPVKSFGETLEWFVAETIRREFSGEVMWGVRFKGSEHGGDYDVVANIGGSLVYTEVKSSPPKHIMQTEISAFFDRTFDLIPDFSIFLMDTELRMKDKLVPMFEAELSQRYPVSDRVEFPVERLFKEIFHIRQRIYIMNTKRSLAENLRICYRAYLKSKLILR